MRRSLVALLAGLLMAGMALAGEPLPISRFEQAENPVLRGAAEGVCGMLGSAAFAHTFNVGPRTFAAWVFTPKAGAQGQFLILDNADGDNTPVWAGVIEADGTLTVRQTYTYKAFAERFPTVCDYFVRQEA